MSKRNTALRLTIAVLVGVMAFSSAQGQHSIPEVTIQKDSSSGELNVSNSGERVTLKAGTLAGVLHGNVSNAGRDGAGFNPLRYTDHPNSTLYRPDQVGLNFEHIFNGLARDYEPSFFTPRVDRNYLVVHSEKRASIRFESESCTWGIGSTMTYTFREPHFVDLTFRCTPTADRFDKGYAAMMWASYMNRTRSREIYFLGREGGSEGWITFGNILDGELEVGTIAHVDASPLPYEKKSRTLNIVEHPTKKFIEPFYYGLVDGDNDLKTEDDTLVYIMMFDQTAPIRFAMWNFIRNAEGKPDTHSPAWDWQYVIRDPKMGHTYGYRARVVIKPWVDRDDVVQEYRSWHKGLDRN